MKRISAFLSRFFTLSFFFLTVNPLAKAAPADNLSLNDNFFNEFVARTWNASDGLTGNTIDARKMYGLAFSILSANRIRELMKEGGE